MKKLRLIFTFCLLCVVPYCIAKADTITLVADEWCPYNCTPGSTTPGFLIEIAAAVFEKAGHKISYQVMPWARAIEESRAGKFSGIVGAYKDDAPDFVFPDPLFGFSDSAFFVKADSTWRYESLKSLANTTLGVIQDYSYGEDFDNYVKKYISDPKRIQVASGEDALQKNVAKLLSGRIDTLIEDSHVMQYYLKAKEVPGRIVSVGSLKSDHIYIAFSPKEPHAQTYARLLSAGTRELEKSGKLKEILAKYGM